MHSILCKEIKNLYKLCTMNKQQQRQHNVGWPCPGRGEASRGEASCSFHSNCRKLLQLLRCRCSFDSNSSSSTAAAKWTQQANCNGGSNEGERRATKEQGSVAGLLRMCRSMHVSMCVYACVLCVCKLCLCPVQGN